MLLYYFEWLVVCELLSNDSLKSAENVTLLKDAYIQLKKERGHHLSLIRAGLEPIFLELNHDDNKEKGVDVALAVSAINKAHNLNMECAIIISNDGDFEPLIHNLRKYGVYTIVIPFIPDYSKVDQVSARLSRSCDVIIPIQDLIKVDEIGSYMVEEEQETYELTNWFNKKFNLIFWPESICRH